MGFLGIPPSPFIFLYGQLVNVIEQQLFLPSANATLVQWRCLHCLLNCTAYQLRGVGGWLTWALAMMLTDL